MLPSGASAGQVQGTVQGHHCLAGARAAGDLGGAAVRLLIGDAVLAGVQEHTPGVEGPVQDLAQLVRARDEGDPATGMGHGRSQRIGRCGSRVARGGGRVHLDHLTVHFLRGHAGGQSQQDVVLLLGKDTVQDFQVGLVGNEPDDGNDLRVDAEAAQHLVRVCRLGKQPRGVLPGHSAQF
ncbi:hypothetical protein ACI3K5_01400 [Streptomyces sp. MPA0124]|uniref:hypothetical protein n=1 Tax=Streptomyces sp. MPA0124 TaxID=3378069 RepID=UPI0038547BBB